MAKSIIKFLPTKKIVFYVFIIGLSIGLLLTLLFKTHLLTLKEGLAAATAKPAAKPAATATAKATTVPPNNKARVAASNKAITANNNKAAAIMQQQYKLLTPKEIADKGLNKGQLRELKNMPKYIGQAMKIANKHNIDVSTVDPTKTVLPKDLQNIMKKIYSVSY